MKKHLAWVAGVVAGAAALVGGTYFLTKQHDRSLPPPPPQPAPAPVSPSFDGTTVFLGPGSMDISVAPNTVLSFALPPGATWVSLTSTDSAVTPPNVAGSQAPQVVNAVEAVEIDAVWRTTTQDLQTGQIGIHLTAAPTS